MAMQASTLRILEAANFSTPQALALGQAIDEGIEGAQRGTQFVTVPLLDVRLAEIKLQIARMEIGLAKLETRLTNKMLAFGLSAMGINITAVFFIVLNLRR
jgi:hypothetical protein